MTSDYTFAMPKFVVLTGEPEILAWEYGSAKTLRFIGNNQAIISVDDYNDIISSQAAEAMIDRYQEQLDYGSYEPY
jgi:hypothetical protein